MPSCGRGNTSPKPEVERLRKTARAGNRNGHRDETMILIAFRHGLRASELVTLRWDAIEHPTLAQAQPIKPLDGVS